MTPTIDGETLESTPKECTNEYGVDAITEVPPARDRAESIRVRAPIPWIGELANPHLGPMVVVGSGGYLVPLWTAGELLRGCKYFWHRSQE